MKRVKLLLLLQFIAFGIYAQSPQLINYQGVARDGNGVVLKNKTIGIRFEFRQGGVSSPTVFVEEQSRTTNSLGLFTAQIGTVNPTDFALVNWDAGALFLQIGIDTTGGTSYINIGSPQQLVSVPYAMQAANVPASYAGNVLTVGKQSFTLSSSTATIDIQQGTNVTVAGSSPNYTISSTPSLNLSAPNTLSISGGNTVDITQTLAINGNTLSVGPTTNSVVLPTATVTALNGAGTGISSVTTSVNSFTVNTPAPSFTQAGPVNITGTYPNFTVNSPAASPQSTLTSSGIGTITSAGTNSFNINVPAPSIAVTTSIGAAGVSSLAPNSFSINIPPATSPIITGLGAAQAGTTAANVFTVDVPLPTYNNATGAFNTGTNVITVAPTLSLTGSVLSSGPSSNSVSIPSAVAQTITGLGAAQAGTTAANVFTVDVPLPTYNNATGAFNTGTNVITVAPTLSLTGNTLTSGPSSNSVTIPTSPTYTAGAGISISSGSIINTAPDQSVTIAQGGIVSVAGGYPSFSVSANPPAILGTGVASVTSASNTFTVNVPDPVLTINAGTLTVTQGTASSSATIPITPNPTITGIGLAIVSPTTGNNFTVSVPEPTLTSAGNSITITQGTVSSTATLSIPNYSAGAGIAITSNSIINTAPDQSVTIAQGGIVSVAGGYPSFSVSANPPAILGTGVASVTSASNAFTVNVPDPLLTINAGTLTVTQGTASSSATLPIAPSPTITGAGIAVVSPTTGNNFTVTVAQPTFAYSQSTGSLTSGTSSADITPTLAYLTDVLTSGPTGNSVSIAPTLSVTGNVLRVGPSANTVNLPTPVTYTNGAGISITSGSIITNTEPNQTVTISQGGIVNMSGTYPNYTVTVNQPTFAYSQTNGSLTSGTSSANITPSLVYAGDVLNSGPSSNSVSIAPTLSVTGNVLRVGPSTNTFNLPTAPIPTITGAGIAVVSPTTGNNFTVTVAQPTFAYSQANGSLTSGTSSAYITPTLVYASDVLSSGPTNNSITIVPTLSISAGVLRVGPVTNTVALPAANSWSLGGNTVGASTTFIGTVDNFALNMRSNNQKAGIIDPAGQTFIGYQAGNVNADPLSTGVGYRALAFNTGAANSAFGRQALEANTTGSANVAFGYRALYVSNTGTANTAVGYGALLNSVGNRNTALGLSAMANNTSGNSNVAIGVETGQLNLNGSNNVFIGSQSGFFETGSNKLYISNSSTSVTPLIYGDFATGRLSINTLTNNSQALNVGGNVNFSGALMPNDLPGTAGQILTSAGSGAPPVWTSATGSSWGLAGNTVGASTTFIGTVDNYALNFRVNNQISGSIDASLSNSFFGYQSGLAIPTGNQNSGFGALTLFTNTSGIQNAAFGVNALAFNSSGSRNTAVGVQALYSNTTGSNNVATGYQALQSNTSGSLNVATGYQALFGNNVGVENIASGYGAMFSNTSGNANTAYGSYALATNNSGSSNVALGYRALNSTSTGSANVAIGRNAGYSNASGGFNVFIGQEAGFYETGSNKLYIANSTTSTTPLIYGDFASGRLSINTVTNNSQALNVGGNVNFSGALMPNNAAGTAGQYLVSAGSGAPPVWASPGTGTNTAWGTLGNAGTTSSNFIGTSDAQPLSVRTNSVERVKIANTGEVGIGISTPSTTFAIGNGTVEKFNINGTNGDMNFLDDQATIQFPVTTATAQPMINMFPSGTANPDRMILSHSPTYSTYGIQYQDASDKMNFLSNGFPVLSLDLSSQNVGIGTNSPGFNSGSARYLSISSTSVYTGATAALELKGSSTNGTVAVAKIDFNSVFGTGTSTNTARIAMLHDGNIYQGELAFSTHNGTILSEAMRIDKTGRVGIGTANPGYLFHVEKDDAGVLAYFDNNSQGSGTGLWAQVATTATTTGNRYGVQGQAYAGQSFNEGVEGRASGGTQNFGVWGQSLGGATSYNIGVYGATTGTVGDYAGYFSGDLSTTGNFSKASGTFKIDHPMDPANKFLIHSFVESPDMMNVYNGNITTDSEGEAIVILPAYFEAENINFKYQLTVIGQFAQAIVLEEVSNNQFIVKTDKPNVKVSWQVTGVRNDKYAQEHRIIPEVEKPVGEKGKYLHPQLFGYGAEMQLGPGMKNPNEENQKK